MANASMNTVIHAAVRRDLDRFADALSRFVPGDRERARQLGLAWANFDSQLTEHHQGEHEIAWPALLEVGVSPATLTQMDAEHETMADALALARGAMGSLESAAGAEEARAALAAIEHLREVTVTHLDHEERETEPVYLAHHDSAPIKEMSRKFRRAQPPPRAGTFFAWLIDGAGPAEQESIAALVPRPVQAVLTTLFARRYRREVAPVWRA